MQEFNLKPGYRGKDPMREMANKAFGKEFRNPELSVPESASSFGREKARLYKKGGEVAAKKGKRLPTNMSFPKPAKKLKPFKQESLSKYENFKKGGCASMSGKEMASMAKMKTAEKGKHLKKPCFEDGGMVFGDESPTYKKGGKAKKKYAEGGYAPLSLGTLGSRAYDFGSRAYSAAKEYGPRALDAAHKFAPTAKKYYPVAKGMVEKYAPEIAGKIRDTYNQYEPALSGIHATAKQYAPRVNDFLNQVSPEHGAQFGKFREVMGLKKGGKAMTKSSKKHCYASGGTVYERDMMGERPGHHKKVNYESEMRGEKSISNRRGFAMGGVGKIRHKQSDKLGAPRSKKGR